MSFEHIEVLKKEHTGSYVVVDTNQPELARFGEQVGVIKTVNMNGKALVEFAETNNIGWFDIALEFLTSVPKPESKAASTKAKAAPAKAKSAPAKATGKSPLERARAAGSAKTDTETGSKAQRARQGSAAAED